MVESVIPMTSPFNRLYYLSSNHSANQLNGVACGEKSYKSAQILQTVTSFWWDFGRFVRFLPSKGTLKDVLDMIR